MRKTILTILSVIILPATLFAGFHFGMVSSAKKKVDQVNEKVAQKKAALLADIQTPAVLTDIQAPTIPTNLTATTVSSIQINLSWTASTDNVGVTRYKIYRDGGATPIATPTGTTYSDTGLIASTAYSYTVSACDAAGNCSAKSTANGDTTYGYELPDTGQILSYTTIFGEDHDYQPAASQPSYTDNGNGTTTDNRTGLMWVKDGNSAGCYYGSNLSWDSAIAFCEGLTYAGYSDWRLPNVRELESIVDAGQNSLAINTTYFLNTKSYIWYWTSSTYAPLTSCAWYLDFVDGVVDYSYKSYGGNVRCVRGGP